MAVAATPRKRSLMQRAANRALASQERAENGTTAVQNSMGRVKRIHVDGSYEGGSHGNLDPVCRYEMAALRVADVERESS